MPIRPVSGVEPLPTETEADVKRIFDFCLSIANNPNTPSLGNACQRGSVQGLAVADPLLEPYVQLSTSQCLKTLAEHLYYISAINPSLYRPLQHDTILLSENEISCLGLGYMDWIYLLRSAPDECVDALVSKLLSEPSDWWRAEMLAGILTPAALSALAEYARLNSKIAEFELMGFAIPEHGPAERRFLLDRYAIKRAAPGDKLAKHFVGLPISDISDGDQPDIFWHYLTLDMSDVPEAKSLLFDKLHFVSPRYECIWDMASRVSSGGRYSVIEVHFQPDDEVYVPESSESCRATLIPFDDSLIYANHHILLTTDVGGDIGGTPIGLYPNPKCPDCNKLMFYIGQVCQFNEFGDGFRSLYVCENCRIATCTASGWN